MKTPIQFEKLLNLLQQIEKGETIAYTLLPITWQFADGVNYSMYEDKLQRDWDAINDEASKNEHDEKPNSENYDPDADIWVLQSMYPEILAPVTLTLWLLYPDQYMQYVMQCDSISIVNVALRSLYSLHEYELYYPPFYPDLSEFGSKVFPFLADYQKLARQIKKLSFDKESVEAVHTRFFNKLKKIVKTPPKYKVKNFKLAMRKNLIVFSLGLTIFYDLLKKHVKNQWLDATIKQVEHYTHKKVQEDSSLIELIWGFEMIHDDDLEDFEVEDFEIVEFEIPADEIDEYIERAYDIIEQSRDNRLEDVLLAQNAHDLIAVYSIVICGMDNLVLISQQLLKSDYSNIYEHYNVLYFPWRDVPKIFNVASSNWIHVVETMSEIDLVATAEYIADELDEFVEETLLDNLQQVRILASKEIHVDYEDAEKSQSSPLSKAWRLKFGKILQQTLLHTFEEYPLELVDISINEFVADNSNSIDHTSDYK